MYKKYVPPSITVVELYAIRSTMVEFCEGSSITDGGGDIEVGAKDGSSFNYDCWHDDEDEQPDSPLPY